MVANPERGEVGLTLAGRDVVLAPTWQAIVSVEQELGQGIAAVFSRIVGLRDYRFGDALAIIGAGRTAAGEKLSRDDVAKDILATGYLNTRDAVILWLTAAINGGKGPETGETAAATDQTGTPSAAS